MAEEQKPVVELPKEEAPAATTTAAAPVADTKPVEETPAVATETPAVEEAKPAEATEATETEAPKAEEKKEEVTPIEEGYLSHKAQGLSFPKNLIASKEFFFFGTDAVEPKTLTAYQKSEKSAETAHSNIAWASHTGKGLLFVGDKKAPTSIINLSDATEPEIDGSNKFHLTSKGNKHTFKAASTAERDNWVSQLKLKIAEAKELSLTVAESETYKQTLESFKPAAPVKKEAEVPKEEAPKTEEVAKPEEAVKEEEAAKEAVKEEPKVEEPKRRSASRKRASFFGFGKKEEKKEEVKAEEPVAPAAATEAPAAAPVTEDKPVEVEAPKTEEAPVAEAVVPAATTEAAAPVAEDKPVEAESPKAESPKEKPSASKRNSFFGGVFGKKEKKAVETKPVEATEPAKEAEAAPATETAPVIPPVETTTPLAVDVSNPATVPVETTETPAATATNGETKKDVKEKRKSSLPFAFGKRDKSPSPAEGEEKSPLSAFSKFRATIKGKTTPKAEEKPAEAAKEDAVKEAETKPEETAVVEAPKEEAAKPVETEAETKTETKPENVAATTTPAVTAAA